MAALALLAGFALVFIAMAADSAVYEARWRALMRQQGAGVDYIKTPAAYRAVMDGMEREVPQHIEGQQLRRQVYRLAGWGAVAFLLAPALLIAWLGGNAAARHTLDNGTPVAGTLVRYSWSRTGCRPVVRFEWQGTQKTVHAGPKERLPPRRYQKGDTVHLLYAEGGTALPPGARRPGNGADLAAWLFSGGLFLLGTGMLLYHLLAV